MSLILHYHPLSSYCWKVLIALYENGTPFEARMVNLGDAEARAAYAALWPTGKIPLLQDDERVVPETSIQIEYLDRHHPGAEPLLPTEPEAQLNVRLWDRLFDFYVMTQMNRCTSQLLRPEADRDALETSQAKAALTMAYDMIETRMGDGPWAAGEAFSMADCAALPSLFYASIYQPFGAGHGKVAAYFERLLERASVKRAIAEAKPFFQYFPLYEAMPARFKA